MTVFARAVGAIFLKDMRAEWRSRELIGVMLLFALLSVLVFSFALELDRLARREAISGVLWVTVVFASVLGLNRSVAQERENGNVDALLLAPIPRAAIFFGKFLANWLFTAVIGALLLPLMTVLYNVTLASLPVLGLLLAGTWGICVTGTLLASMTLQTRVGEALLPIALLPIALPLLLGTVRATTGILTDAPVNDWGGWVGILLGIDLFYTVVCMAFYGVVVEE